MRFYTGQNQFVVTLAKQWAEQAIERGRGPSIRVPRAFLPAPTIRPDMQRALETGRQVAARRRWSSAAIEPRPPWRESYGW